MKVNCSIALALSASVAVALQQCERHVELMILQDASTSFIPMSSTMAENMGLLMDRIQERIGSVNASVALFSDKPTPFRGNGKGRGHPGVLDLCYYNGATHPLGTNTDELQEGYEAILKQKCEGGDYPENPYEAMIYAAQDPVVNWSPANKTYTDDNKRIVKVMVTVTDDHPHYAGDAFAGVQAWNPINETILGDTYPRFYDRDFVELNVIYGDTAGSNKVKYLRLVQLHEKDNLNSDEEAELAELITFLGPDNFNLPLPHTGSFDSYQECEKFEYPELKLVGSILNDENILPIMLLSKQSFNNNGVRLCENRGFTPVKDEGDWLKCLLAIYKSDLKQAGVNAFMVEPYGDQVEQLMSQIVDLVDQISHDISCPDDPIIPPGIIPSSDHKAATVAGASGGAAAAAAAIAGLLYKKFGASLLGSSTPPDLATIEQVETPDTPIEREAFEEVTMDMFQ